MRELFIIKVKNMFEKYEPTRDICVIEGDFGQIKRFCDKLSNYDFALTKNEYIATKFAQLSTNSQDYIYRYYISDNFDIVANSDYENTGYVICKEEEKDKLKKDYEESHKGKNVQFIKEKILTVDEAYDMVNEKFKKLNVNYRLIKDDELENIN